MKSILNKELQSDLMDEYKALNYCIKHNSSIKDTWNKLLTVYKNTIYDPSVVKFALDYFGAQVCAYTIMDNPILMTGDYTQKMLDDVKRYVLLNKLPVKLSKSFVKRANKLMYTDWILYPNKKASTISAADFADSTLSQIVKPLVGKTEYKPKDVKNDIERYKKHFAIDRQNYDICEEVSISDELDNNQDRIGLMLGQDVVRYVDKYCLQQLKAGNYSRVLGPDDLEASFI